MASKDSSKLNATARAGQECASNLLTLVLDDRERSKKWTAPSSEAETTQSPLRKDMMGAKADRRPKFE